MSKINVVVIGTGMYVCGRGTDGYGTVIPAIFESARKIPIGDIFVVGNTLSGTGKAKARIREVQNRMGLRARDPLVYFPRGGDDRRSYLEAIRAMPKPACAIIAVPDNLHYEVARAAISEGLHTLVVKPLAPTLKEVNSLVRLQGDKGVYCAVEFHKRYDLANLMLKDVIEKGRMGDPVNFIAEFSQRRTMPSRIFKKWVRNTNVFQYLGIHYIDIVYFATGAVPKRAMAIGQKNWLKSKGMDVFDSVEGLVEWQMPSGKRFSSCILTSWIDPDRTSAMSDQKIKVIGTKGRFESDQKYRGITIVTDAGGMEEPNPYFCTACGIKGNVRFRGYGVESISQFLKDVSDIEDGLIEAKDLEGTRPTFRQSVIPTAVLEAVNRSLKKGGSWIDIDMSEIKI